MKHCDRCGYESRADECPACLLTDGVTVPMRDKHTIRNAGDLLALEMTDNEWSVNRELSRNRD